MRWLRWLRLPPNMSLARCTHAHGRFELYSTTSSSLDAALSPFCSREIYCCDIESKLYVSLPPLFLLSVFFTIARASRRKDSVRTASGRGRGKIDDKIRLLRGVRCNESARARSS